jgi:hydroxyacylglutathione hydrolase
MELKNENMNERGMIYGKWMTSPNTWTISFGGGVYCYLIIGEEKALLFDTAYGIGNLRAFVEGITDKPVMVVNSHGHFDHTGGNPWWPEVWAGPGAEESMKVAFSPEMQEDFNKKPYPDYTVHTVREGHIFDLGGRQLEVIEIPAHHESSIALLDCSNRALYSGDELEAGQVLLFVRNHLLPLREVVTNHLNNMKKLKAHWDEFDTIYPAHNGPQLYKSYIDDYIALSEHILSGDAQIMPNLAGFGWAPSVEGSPFAEKGELERAQYGGASFIYVKE